MTGFIEIIIRKNSKTSPKKTGSFSFRRTAQTSVKMSSTEDEPFMVQVLKISMGEEKNKVKCAQIVFIFGPRNVFFSPNSDAKLTKTTSYTKQDLFQRLRQ